MRAGTTAHFTKLAPVLLLVFGLAGATGCLSKSLSDEAKPRTPAEHWLVAVQEYRLLADQATAWVEGLTQAAEAGDPTAAQYAEAAIRVGRYLDQGNSTIQLASAAIAAGDFSSLDGYADTLDHLIGELQKQAFMSAGGI